MQSLKCWLAVGVTVCALSVRGDDTDAQAKAREALEKKLNELQGQPAQPAPAKPATKPPQAKPASAKQAATPQTAAPQTATPQTPAVPSSTLNTPPGADAAAIEKARAAMREKMNTPVATEVPPPAPAPKITVQPPAETAPAAAPPPPPVATPPPAAPPPVVAVGAAAAAASVVSSPTPPPPATMPDLPPPSDPEAIAKAREALRQKMNELQAGQPAPPPQPPPATPAPPSPPAVPAAPAAAAAAATIQPPSTPELTAPPEADPAAIAKAREAMRMRMQTLGPETEIVSMHPGKATQMGMNFPPLQAPPLGISDAKELRLRELLQQYRSDLISPEQYQASRAKILAEP